jgi:hypothetical protein
MGTRVVRRPKHADVFTRIRPTDESWGSAGAAVTHITLHDSDGVVVGSAPLSAAQSIASNQTLTINPGTMTISGGSGGSTVLSGGGANGMGIVTPIPSTPFDETNVLEGGEVIVTHRLNDCDGYWCCIHNPSPHHMRGWTQTFNFPMKAIMRVCPCGDEHPDPDERWRSRHTCKCGCCSPKGRVIQKRRKRVSA